MAILLLPAGVMCFKKVRQSNTSSHCAREMHVCRFMPVQVELIPTMLEYPQAPATFYATGSQ